jgi:hypothetical protein
MSGTKTPGVPPGTISALAEAGNALAEAGRIYLDADDPFEAALVEIVLTNRRKRADYALDGSPWSNFDFTAGVVGITAAEAAIHNVAQKLARLAALKANGRTKDPKNEGVNDTYLDLAVYGVIAYAIRKYPNGRVRTPHIQA